MNAEEKHRYFQTLIHAVNECDLCSRLCTREKVLSEFNGNIFTKVLFIAEAPGRLGADMTKVPLFGDRTGDNFEKLLKNINWTRDQIFITNAVLCNPRNDRGNNDKPTPVEILNCRNYLEMIITLIQPSIIVTLGISALNALNNIKRHSFILKNYVGETVNWNGYKLMPLYHPAPRALVHRNMVKQRSDYIGLANIVNPTRGLKDKSQKPLALNQHKLSEQMALLILLILNRYRIVSYFKVAKLLYLVDLYFLTKYGLSFTKEIYIRQKDGPWSPAINRTTRLLERDGVIKRKSMGKEIYLEVVSQVNIELDNQIYKEISEFISKYDNLDNFKMKFAAYRTSPMRLILEREKMGESFLNKPVLFSDHSIIEILESKNSKKEI